MRPQKRLAFVVTKHVARSGCLAFWESIGLNEEVEKGGKDLQGSNRIGDIDNRQRRVRDNEWDVEVANHWIMVRRERQVFCDRESMVTYEDDQRLIGHAFFLEYIHDSGKPPVDIADGVEVV